MYSDILTKLQTNRILGQYGFFFQLPATGRKEYKDTIDGLRRFLEANRD